MSSSPDPHDAERPAHPTFRAGALMVGVVVLLLALAVVSTVG